jgi:type I restriction enzyme M protein
VDNSYYKPNPTNPDYQIDNDNFRNIDFNSSNLGDAKDKSTRLRNLLNDFKSLDLSQSHLENNDVIGGAYEFLIANFASDSGKKAGEFYTPHEVSVLMSEIIAHELKDKKEIQIYDPTSGSGSLLIKASKVICNNNFRIYTLFIKVFIFI